MKRWEYMLISDQGLDERFGEGLALIDQLNSMGLTGWEAWGMEYVGTTQYFYFKREINPATGKPV